jgi:histidinol dehydrogenase
VPLRLDDRTPDFEAAFTRLVGRARGQDPDVRTQVAAILARIAAEGDAALLEYTARFDRQKLTPEQLRLSEAEISKAVADCPAALRQALEFAAARITAFHRRQLPESFEARDDQGVGLGLRWRPIAAVGIYVPGGTAAYPS